MAKMNYIDTPRGPYFPTSAEVTALSARGVMWPDFKAKFPPHHPNDAQWEAANGSYLWVHRFEDTMKATA